MYVKAATKSSKKTKNKKKTNRKKFTGKKFSFKINKNVNSRVEDDWKSEFPYSQTFDGMMSSIYKEGSTKCHEMHIFENFSCGRNKERGKEFNK
mmetsp:Transcript_19731/g.22056  ORF Transcript_19731/g.22056 Transcript_19731/m.22056 type:complete len:94 (-) Transcript_19731:188-469(-)